MIACDFLTVDTVWLRRLYVLFFIELESRRAWLAGCTQDPSGTWVTAGAQPHDRRRRPGASAAPPDPRPRREVQRSDEVFQTEGIEIIRTPLRAPNANAHAERFVRTVREECLDSLLVFGRRHLERVLCEYVDHYNRERPHRGAPVRPGASSCAPRHKA